MFFPDENVETGNAVEIIIPALNELIKILFFTFLHLAAIPPSLLPILSVPFEPFSSNSSDNAQKREYVYKEKYFLDIFTLIP